jgi:hypothetical protein
MLTKITRPVGTDKSNTTVSSGELDGLSDD